MAERTIPVPSFTDGDSFRDDIELLASGVGWTQKGAVVAGGQGILKVGTLMSRLVANNKWVKYTNAYFNGCSPLQFVSAQSAADVGSHVAIGFLRQAVDTGDPLTATFSGSHKDASGGKTLPGSQVNIVTVGKVRQSHVFGS